MFPYSERNSTHALVDKCQNNASEGQSDDNFQCPTVLKTIFDLIKIVCVFRKWLKHLNK